MSIDLEHLTSPTPEARVLIAELDAELAGPYSVEQRHGLNVERIFQPHVMFFLAHLDGLAVGCGGIAFDDGFAELKRMYVRPSARGQGVAAAIVARLEAEARARGGRRVVLETGDAQLAAMKFYERAGFTKCGAFGLYAAMPAAAIVRSVFFEKWV